MLKTRFVGDIPDDRTQVYGAIRGLVGSYKDPYTTFLEPAPRRLERDEIRGHFGGIGATLSRDEAGALVLTVMRDRPAARAGVRDGDVLLAVDGTTITADMPVRDVVDLIRGEEGTKVRLTLRRAGVAEPFEIVIVRERIEVPSVEWRILSQTDHIGYVKITIFGERTDQELQIGLNELAAQGVNRLVLDLRGNGGGLVETAVDVASRFLADGVLLYEVRRGGQERFYEVKRVSSPAHGWPLAVLVDAGTASASEIVAGALRDRGRAVLIGEKTYGKGSVQEVHELADGSSLHVTVARWLTPARHQIDKVGLTPDVPVTISSADRDAGRDPQLAKAQEWLREKR
ncbi:MAG: S41 family peptidase [Anaerolineae bacterium]